MEPGFRVGECWALRPLDGRHGEVPRLEERRRRSLTIVVPAPSLSRPTYLDSRPLTRTGGYAQADYRGLA